MDHIIISQMGTRKDDNTKTEASKHNLKEWAQHHVTNKQTSNREITPNLSFGHIPHLGTKKELMLPNDDSRDLE